MAQENSVLKKNSGFENFLQEMVTSRVKIQTLSETLRSCQEERTLLEYQLKGFMGNRQNLDQQLEQLTKRNLELETLFIVAIRLLSITSREDVYFALRDIVANVIGSEEMVLWSLDPANQTITALTTCGVDVSSPEIIATCQKVVGNVLANNEPFFAIDENDKPVCCIPVRSTNGVICALTIHTMLPQKPTLETSDSEVLKLLEIQLGALLEKYPDVPQGGAA